MSPMHYSPPGPAASGEPTKRVRFWLKSGRGTDRSEVVEVPADWGKEDIRGELEEWCEQFPAWHVSENTLSYGFEEVKAGDTAKES